MCWGFSCGDGWYKIIYELSEKITSIIAKDPKLDPKEYSASQVKEKFGGLRFYMSATNEDISQAISTAAQESFKTCERCGEPGELRQGDWLRTLCDGCKERKAESVTRGFGDG